MTLLLAFNVFSLRPGSSVHRICGCSPPQIPGQKPGQKSDQTTATNLVVEYMIYAQNVILVSFILVNFFSFLLIARDYGSYEGRHWVEMNPTDLLDLSKPTFLKSNRGKHQNLEVNIFALTRKNLTSIKCLA